MFQTTIVAALRKWRYFRGQNGYLLVAFRTRSLPRENGDISTPEDICQVTHVSPQEDSFFLATNALLLVVSSHDRAVGIEIIMIGFWQKLSYPGAGVVSPGRFVDAVAGFDPYSRRN